MDNVCIFHSTKKWMNELMDKYGRPPLLNLSE